MRNQEKLYDLLDTPRAGVETAGTLALGTLGLACQGAERLAGGVKLRYEAARVEGEMDEKLMEAGEMVYATHTGSPTESEELLEKLREIDASKAQLAGLNETLGRRPEAPACPGCGEAVGEGDHFCRSCGEKLD